MEVFVFGIYERIATDIRQAHIIMDIGANVGFFAIYASVINPKAEIHAFEPFPKNIEQMKRNFQLNLNGRIHLHPEAVSDKNGVAELYFTPGDDSGCSLNQTKGQSCSVNVVSINNLPQICQVEKYDLLKMDCEGSELAILKTLSPDVLGKISAVILEYHVLEELGHIQGILSHAGFRCEVLPQINTVYASRR